GTLGTRLLRRSRGLLRRFGGRQRLWCFGSSPLGSDLAGLPQHGDGTAGFLDRVAGAGAEGMGFHRQSALEAAGTQNLDLLALVDEPFLEQRVCVNPRPVRG